MMRKKLKKTLSSFQQHTAAALEILVVDNGSTDGTPERIRERRSADERITVLVGNRIQSSYAARNKGVRNANTDVFVFIDADMTVPEDWLECALRAFESSNADYMGCNVELTLPSTPSLAARYDRYTGFPIRKYIEQQEFAPTCCLFVRRAVFEDVGLFDHRLISGGDKEFGNRVVNAGYDMHFADSATMYHPARFSVRSLIEKELRVGRGHCQLQRYYPDRYGKPGIPPRPSGAKSPRRQDGHLRQGDHVAFSTLSTVLTGARGVGYASEFIDPTDSGTDRAIGSSQVLDE
jgi:GT2 family glycosyltransferase